IDVDKNQPIAQRFGVRSIPTLILFQGGEIKWKKAGVVTKRELTQALSQA
ncbi:MAG: thioredoxin family protein, partial [Roseivirga sp.]|nr:thioredoxin family protein [Roseivirga sp.]